jgi:hypothetical protein
MYSAVPKSRLKNDTFSANKNTPKTKHIARKSVQPDPLRDGTVLLHFLGQNPLDAEGLESGHFTV